MAAMAKGMAMSERFNVNLRLIFDIRFITRRKHQENPKAPQAPSGRSTFEKINRRVITSFTLESRL
jgi:hypothetical protein